MPIYTNFTGRGNHEIFKNDITHKKLRMMKNVKLNVKWMAEVWMNLMCMI